MLWIFGPNAESLNPWDEEGGVSLSGLSAIVVHDLTFNGSL